MTHFLFYTLIALSAAFLLHGLRRPEGVFQFPVLFSGTFLFSIVPQLWNHVFNPGRLHQNVYDHHGVEYGILMCILCLVAGHIGYYTSITRLPRWHERLPRISDKHLLPIGILLGLIGLYGTLSLDLMAGGLGARYTEGGHYGLSWTGMAVVYAYLSAGLPLALLLTLNHALAKRSLYAWAIVAAAAVYPVLNVIILGRRTMLIRLAIFVGATLWFRKRWVPPRVLVIGGMALAGLAIITASAYRTYASRTGDMRGALAQVDVAERLTSYAEGDHAEGMDNLIIGIPARMQSMSFSLGSSLWNSTINMMVPAVFVGHAFKNSLYIRIGRPDNDVFYELAATDRMFGSFSIGPYSIFREWHFFGCLFYFVLARFFHKLWYRAMHQNDLLIQILYIATLLFVPLAVIDSHSATFARGLQTWLILLGGTIACTFVIPSPASKHVRQQKHTLATNFRQPLAKHPHT